MTELGAARGDATSTVAGAEATTDREQDGGLPAAGRSLYYAGRRGDLTAPSGWTYLDSWSVLPVRLGPLLDEAEHLTVRDPMSFPFDAMRDDDRDVPLAVELPGEWDADDLTRLFGAPLLDHLTPFDAIVLRDEETWRALRARYSWPAAVRVAPEVIDDAVQPTRLGTRRQKSAYRQLGALIRPRLGQAMGAVPAGERPSVLVLARNVDRWTALLPLSGATVTGLELDPEALERDRVSFPEWRFEREFPAGGGETAHISLSVLSLCQCAATQRRHNLAGLLRGLRVGGHLIIVDRFLEGRGGRAIGAPAPAELLADVREASTAGVVLEHVETLRLSGDDLVSVGLLAFTKLGRPERL
jgi:hypothetical protein